MALPRIGVGFGQVSEVQAKEWGGHTAAQTAAAIVMALAAVFGVVTQSTNVFRAAPKAVVRGLAISMCSGKRG